MKIQSRFNFRKLENGQTLVTVVVFVIIAMIITAGGIVLTLSNSRASSNVDVSSEAYYIAEAGIENALIRLLRDPFYSGETLSVDQGTAQISVSSASAYTITSVGRLNDFSRTIRVNADYAGGILSITSWSEVF